MRRKRRDDAVGGSFERMRWRREMTVVLEGWAMSRGRSGIEVVNRTVTWSGLTGAIPIAGNEMEVML